MNKSKTSLYWALALIFITIAFLWNMAIGFMSWYFYLDTSDMRRVSLGILFIVAVLFEKRTQKRNVYHERNQEQRPLAVRPA